METMPIKKNQRYSILLVLLALFFSTTSSLPSSAKEVTIAGERPFSLVIPKNYNSKQTTPLILMLHGYSGDPTYMKNYQILANESERKGVLLAFPIGTKDKQDMNFWNATQACCNFNNSTIDDQGYLIKVVDKISRTYSIDQKAIFIIGHSNGGFMAHRMACNHSGKFAAIASIAGAGYLKPSDCAPNSPVSILQIHGTLDPVIKIEGGQLGKPYPSAMQTVSDWANRNQCSKKPTTAKQTLDFDKSITGAETSILSYAKCNSTTVALWRIKDGAHAPIFNGEFSKSLINWLLTNKKQ